MEPVSKLQCHPQIKKDLPLHQERGWGMLLTYKKNTIGERGLPWGIPWMGVIGSLSWSSIEIVGFL